MLKITSDSISFSKKCQRKTHFKTQCTLTAARSGRFRHKSWIKWAKFKPHGFSRPLTASSSCTALSGERGKHMEKTSSLTHLLSLAIFKIQMQCRFYGNYLKQVWPQLKD